MLEDFGTDLYAGIWSTGIYPGAHRAYFNGGVSQAAAGMWTSDRTAAGTQFVSSMVVLGATTINDHLYGFGCYYDGTPTTVGCEHGPLFFTSDGTADGTSQVAGVVSVDEVVTLGNSVFMAANGELWRYVP